MNKALDKYIDFNITKFLIDSRYWSQQRKQQQNKLESITELRGMDKTPLLSGKLHDATAETAFTRMEIEREIEQINQREKLLQEADKTLTEAEHNAIDAFFNLRLGTVEQRALFVAAENRCTLATAYQMRKTALEKLKAYILGELQNTDTNE